MARYARNPYARRAGGHRPAAYRSGLEDKVADQLRAAGVLFEYETVKLGYTVPAKDRKYTPDFILPNGIIVETKGMFVPEDRRKMQLVKAQHPDLDIRFVFNNPNAKLYKKSPTSYAMWCDKEGFPCAAKTVPEDWIKEPVNARSLAALKALDRKVFNR